MSHIRCAVNIDLSIQKAKVKMHEMKNKIKLHGFSDKWNKANVVALSLELLIQHKPHASEECTVVGFLSCVSEEH